MNSVAAPRFTLKRHRVPFIAGFPSSMMPAKGRYELLSLSLFARIGDRSVPCRSFRSHGRPFKVPNLRRSRWPVSDIRVVIARGSVRVGHVV